MLILTRYGPHRAHPKGQAIVIAHPAGDVVVRVEDVHGNRIRLSVTAPREVAVHREEHFASEAAT